MMDKTELQPLVVEICDKIKVEKVNGGYEIFIDGVRQDKVVAFSINLDAHDQVATFTMERIL